MIGPRLIDLGNPVADHPLNRNLVGWWLCLPHSMGGSRLFDLGGRYHGTLTNNPTWQGPAGRPSGYGSIKFPGIGTNTSVTVTSVAALHPTGSFSACGWFLGTGSSAIGAPQNTAGFGAMGNGSNRGWQLGAYTNGFGCTVAPTSSTLFTATVGSHDSAAWVWYAMVFRASVGLYLFRNGVLVGSNTTSPPSSLYASSINFQIGRRGDGDGSVAFTGQEDDIRVANRDWTEQEVAALYDQSRLGHPDTLRRYTPRAWYFPYETGGAPAAVTPRLLSLLGVGC